MIYQLGKSPPAAGTRPIVAVSACLGGLETRYDGGHRVEPDLVTALEQVAEIWFVCPEIEAGFGVPRPTIELRWSRNSLRVIDAHGADRSDVLHHTSRRLARDAQSHQVVAFVGKARSPSCGAGDTPHLNERGKPTEFGDGVLISTLRTNHPGIRIVSNEALRSSEAILALIKWIDETAR